MSESTDALKSLIESLITRFDESKVVTDKHLEAQLAFNTQVSIDLAHHRKQIDLTQADVDEVRPQRERPAAHPHINPLEGAAQAAAATTPPNQPRASDRFDQVARLFNEGPPLIPTKPAATLAGVPAGGMRPPPRGLPPVYPQVSVAEDHYVKPPKHDFPRFSGDAPKLWIDHCVAYFELYRVSLRHRVTTATLYIEGHATHWLQAYRQHNRAPTWETFTAALVAEFGPDEFETEMHKLLQLRQTGTVAEYRLAFEEHMYHLLALDASLNPKLFITQFPFCSISIPTEVVTTAG